MKEEVPVVSGREVRAGTQERDTKCSSQGGNSGQEDFQTALTTF